MTRLFFDIFHFDTIPLVPLKAYYEWDTDTIRVYAGVIYVGFWDEDKFIEALPKTIEHEYIHCLLRKAVGRQFFRSRNISQQIKIAFAEEMAVLAAQGVALSPLEKARWKHRFIVSYIERVCGSANLREKPDSNI